MYIYMFKHVIHFEYLFNKGIICMRIYANTLFILLYFKIFLKLDE